MYIPSTIGTLYQRSVFNVRSQTRFRAFLLQARHLNDARIIFKHHQAGFVVLRSHLHPYARPEPPSTIADRSRRSDGPPACTLKPGRHPERIAPTTCAPPTHTDVPLCCPSRHGPQPRLRARRHARHVGGFDSTHHGHASRCAPTLFSNVFAGACGLRAAPRDHPQASLEIRWRRDKKKQMKCGM